MNYEVLLYYKYVDIADPETFREEQRQLCDQLSIKGRILVSEEGINGTVEGTTENTTQYIAAMRSDPRFADIQFKRSVGTGTAFPKLKVKYRPEIVATKLDEVGMSIDPKTTTGKYLEPDQLQEWFSNEREFYIVDMRNDYEFKSGYFENSLFAPFENFRDLPKVAEELEELKDKTIVTVCTGGIRCEKASGFLVANGFNDVYQLHGGMHTYMEKYPNQHFLGKLFVFDNRMLVGFNTDAPEHVVVGKCDLCRNQSENYVNCSDVACHKLIICCENCLADNGNAYCSEKCSHKGSSRS